MQLFLRIVFICVFVVLHYAFCFADSGDVQDSVHIPEVKVQGRMYPEVPGFKNTALDTLALGNNQTNSIAEVLSKHTPVIIKSYNSGGLTTSSFRGASASHTNVLWNGIKINSPMLGQVDFSLVPSFFVDKMNLNHGSASMCEQSGALGGSIDMENKPEWKNRFSLQSLQSIGSFDTYKGFGALKAGNNTYQSETKVLYRSSANDYPYLNTEAGEEPVEMNRKHAGYENKGFLQNLYLKQSNNTFSVHLWGQSNTRNIPSPINVSSKDLKQPTQEDQFFRSMIEWNHYTPSGGKLTVRTAYLYNFLNYENNLAGIHSKNTSHSFITKGHYSANLTAQTLLRAGISSTYNQIHTVNYEGVKERFIHSIYGSLKSAIGNRGSLFGLLRQDFLDDQVSGWPLPTLGFNYQLFPEEKLVFKANVARNHHIPTLNDLYWNSAFGQGNPDLEPEEGYTAEAGFAYDLRNTGLSKAPHLEVNGYFSSIRNWILWLPEKNNTWSPENLKKVHLKGIESTYRIAWELNGVKCTWTGGYSYNLALNRDAGAKDLNQNTFNKQLIYVPKHQANSSLYLAYKGIQAGFTWSLTGKRYITADHSKYLSAYSISNVDIGKMFRFEQFNIHVNGKVRNILDESYQMIPYHPMPGRSYLLSVKLKYNH